MLFKCVFQIYVPWTPCIINKTTCCYSFQYLKISLFLNGGKKQHSFYLSLTAQFNCYYTTDQRIGGRIRK